MGTRKLGDSGNGNKNFAIDTRLIHEGEPSPRVRGAVSLPIFQSSTFETGDEVDYHDVRYIRLNNTPNHETLHHKIANLEGGEAGLVSASGMALITTILLSFLRSGDHLLAQDSLYGGTYDFICHELERMGIEYDFVDGADPSTWKAKLRPNTKMFYVESISNPLMQVSDVAETARFARSHGLISVIDNTFASPVNFRPLDHGIDIALHSGSKYLNGHTDIVCGAAAGPARLIDQVRIKLAYYGGTLDPHACFLLHRGLKTLAVRVRQQNENALTLARALAEHPAVTSVLYPGLESHPHHARASQLFEGFGGMVSFEVQGGRDAALKLIDSLQIPIYAPSLGGVEALVTFPAMTSHAGMTPEQREAVGITDGLVRVSVGIESGDDLVRDFHHALSTLPVQTPG